MAFFSRASIFLGILTPMSESFLHFDLELNGQARYIWSSQSCPWLQWDGANPGFVIQELDSVQFLYDIIFCFESDSIVVSFSSRTGFLGADVI